MQTTVEVSGHSIGAAQVGLAVSATSDMRDARILPPSPPNRGGWNKWSVTGLRPGQRYYVQLTDPAGQLFGRMTRLSTLRPVGRPCTITLAVGSCEQTTPASTYAFDDIAAWAPDRMMHLGDFGYPGYLSKDPLTHMRNWAENSADKGIRAVQEIGCMDYIASDHDTNGSGVPNRPNYNDPITKANIIAWRRMVPARMADTRAKPKGRFRADVEGNVRFVKLDTRSLEKSDVRHPPKSPEDGASTMLGEYQLEWLKGQILAAAEQRQLVILFSDTSWNGTSPWGPGGIPVSFDDKWGSYIWERDAISDYAASRGVDMFIVHGDSHGLQQDDGTNEKNGFAAICCGPLDCPLHMHFQENYQWNYPGDVPDGGGPYRHGQQYHRLTISQESDSSTITVTADARDCSQVDGVPPLTVRTMVKTYQL